MVHEPQLKPLLVGAPARSRSSAATLIAAANEAGGRDNITVILFRLEEVDAPAPAAAPAAASAPTRTPPSTTRSRARRSPSRARASRAPGARAARRAGDDGRGGVPRHGHGRAVRRCARAREPIEERRRRTRRRAATAAPAAPARCRAAAGGSRSAAIVALLLVVACWLGRRRAGLLRRHRRRRTATSSPSTRGLPYDLPLGIKLYSPLRALGRDAESVPRRAPHDLHRPQAALAATTPRTSSTRSRRDSCSQ